MQQIHVLRMHYRNVFTRVHRVTFITRDVYGQARLITPLSSFYFCCIACSQDWSSMKPRFPTRETNLTCYTSPQCRFSRLLVFFFVLESQHDRLFKSHGSYSETMQGCRENNGQKQWRGRGEFAATIGTLHDHGNMPGLLQRELTVMSQMYTKMC